MNLLQDIQIVSLALNIPGPVAAARLRRFGAEVVKVEPPSGDPLALACPDWYAELHRGMEILTLDLKTAAGQQNLHGLLAKGDLVLTSMRPAALKRLGLDWQTLSARYPRLCQVAIVGYPAPDDEKVGHDLTYQASLGLFDPPRLPRTVLADLAGAEWAVNAALALLLRRERGQGNHYQQVALLEAAASFAEPLRHGLTAPGGLLGGGLPGYNLYRAQDGWVAVAALEPHFLQKLAQALNLPDLNPKSLAEAFAAHGAAYWEAWAAERDLPIAAVRNISKTTG